MWAETKQGLHKQFVFKDFQHAWEFMEKVSAVIDDHGHHPRWQNEWNVVDFWLSTHSEQGKITEKDWELARAIDDLADAFRNNAVETVDVTNTTSITEVQVYADGGSRGNPGPSASGFVILDMSGKILHKEGVYLGITTNNQAEYQALKLGLEAAFKKFNARVVHVYMDSLLVINQMKGIYKVRNRDLWPVHDSIQKILQKFEKVSFDHVPRELNKLADAEVNICLDAQQTPEQIK